jgi:hypothetical protein
VLKFLITLSITAIGILVLSLRGMEKQPDFLYQTIIFLFLATAGLYRFLLKTKQERPDYFVQLYLLTLVVKIIASSAYLFVMVVGQPEPARDVVFFMAVYFVFTALEIAFLYRRVNE